MRTARLTLAAAALLVALPGCDDGAKAKAAADAKAKADAKKADEAKATAKRKADREAEAKADDDEAKALAARIEALAVVPEALPKTLDKACEQMLAAYDGFMRKVLEGDMLTKWETGGNEMQLAVFGKECRKRSIATAACQAHALSNATPDLEKSLPAIMKACADKGSAAPG